MRNKAMDKMASTASRFMGFAFVFLSVCAGLLLLAAALLYLIVKAGGEDFLLAAGLALLVVIAVACVCIYRAKRKRDLEEEDLAGEIVELEVEELQ